MNYIRQTKSEFKISIIIKANDADSKCDSDSKGTERKFYSLGRTRYQEEKSGLHTAEYHSNTIHRSGKLYYLIRVIVF